MTFLLVLTLITVILIISEISGGPGDGDNRDSRPGGMADTGDSKSPVRKNIRVQVSGAAPMEGGGLYVGSLCYCRTSDIRGGKIIITRP